MLVKSTCSLGTWSSYQHSFAKFVESPDRNERELKAFLPFLLIESQRCLHSFNVCLLFMCLPAAWSASWKRPARHVPAACTGYPESRHSVKREIPFSQSPEKQRYYVTDVIVFNRNFVESDKHSKCATVRTVRCDLCASTPSGRVCPRATRCVHQKNAL